MCLPAPEAVLKGAVFHEYFSERLLWSPVPVTGDLFTSSWCGRCTLLLIHMDS